LNQHLQKNLFIEILIESELPFYLGHLTHRPGDRSR
jgi:hypothetical protein